MMDPVDVAVSEEPLSMESMDQVCFNLPFLLWMSQGCWKFEIFNS